ncbi:hypothetical protein [Wolbachia endosymbiont of Nomada ferruginata]|uniref:hypothetical protein n=1 Tax=Wolbachia endosymbiont of Nomada ferruginata TaxID=1854761 RepID=UPI000A640BA5|nr:hypothetical protein [Wolbachia endosymbiont of Nomada ferruginata]
MLTNLIKFLDPSVSYLDDTLLWWRVLSSHNVHIVVYLTLRFILLFLFYWLCTIICYASTTFVWL